MPNWTQDQYNEWLSKKLPRVGALENPQHPKSTPALERHSTSKQSGKNGVEYLVSIIGFRHRILDSDNFTSGAKPLRDAISETIGIDDGSERIRFEYDQVHTTGEEGVLVKIELKSPA